MRSIVFTLWLLTGALHAQDAERFQRALHSGNERALDGWMKREIHDKRKGWAVSTSGPTFIRHAPTFDSLVAFLRRQPDVLDAAWDGCTNKILLWPGHSTIGMQWTDGDVSKGRCWHVQEGIPGTINLFGWRPKVRGTLEHLKYKGARECTGFVEQQRKHCAENAH